MQRIRPHRTVSTDAFAQNQQRPAPLSKQATIEMDIMGRFSNPPLHAELRAALNRTGD
jgi:hypothetical protein